MVIIIGLQKQFYNWVTKTKLLWLQKQRERLGYKNKERERVTKTQRGYKNTKREWVTKTIGLQKKITRLQKPGYKKSFTPPLIP